MDPQSICTPEAVLTTLLRKPFWTLQKEAFQVLRCFERYFEHLQFYLEAKPRVGRSLDSFPPFNLPTIHDDAE